MGAPNEQFPTIVVAGACLCVALGRLCDVDPDSFPVNVNGGNFLPHERYWMDWIGCEGCTKVPGGMLWKRVILDRFPLWNPSRVVTNDYGWSLNNASELESLRAFPKHVAGWFPQPGCLFISTCREQQNEVAFTVHFLEQKYCPENMELDYGDCKALVRFVEDGQQPVNKVVQGLYRVRAQGLGRTQPEGVPNQAFLPLSRETDSLWGSIFGSYDVNPFCSDLDGDGDIDCLVGLYDGTVTLVERTGQSYYSFSSFYNVFAHDVGQNACPFCTDLDEDGKLDCLVGDSNGKVTHLRRDTFRWTVVSSNFFQYDVGSISCPFCFDVDGDGLTDCIVGQGDGYISLMLRNPGSPMTFTVASTTFFGRNFGSRAAPSCMTLEGGGWDCFVGNAAGLLAYMRLNSTGAWYVESSNILNWDIGSNAAPYCLDLDGDHHVECVVGGSAGVVQLFKQTTTRDFVEMGTVFSDVGGYAAPTCFETSGNESFLNCFVGNSAGVISLFRTDPSLTEPFVLNNSNVLGTAVPGGYASPTCLDFDGDGRMDCFVGTGNGLVEQWTWNGTAWVLVNNNRLATDVGYSAQPSFVDMDNDGDLDCLVGNGAGSVYFFRQTSAGTFQRESTNFFGTQVTGPARPVCVDIDNDGRLECMVGEQYGRVVLFRNIGVDGEFQWVKTLSDFFLYDVGSYAAPFCMDWRRDGRLNCLVGANDGLTRHWQQDDPAGAFYTRGFDVFGSVGSYASPMCTDLHGDGRLGCVIGNSAGFVYYFSHSGVAAMDGFTRLSTNLLAYDVGSYAAPFCLDTDEDGDKDCLVGAYNGMVYHFRNDVFLWTLTSNNFFSFDVGSYAKPFCGDFDNDGDTDCLVGDMSGKVTYFRNEGSSWTPLTRDFFQYSVGSYASPFCWDVDSDGDLDCIVGSVNGFSYYFQNNGSISEPSWVLADAGYLSDVGSYASPFCMDVDRDGDVDCFVGRSSGDVVPFINHQNLSVTAGPLHSGPCPEGSYRHGDECEQCPAGRHASRGTCAACPAGTYSEGGLSPCRQLLADWLAKHGGNESFSVSASHDGAGIVKIQLAVPTLPAAQLYGNVTPVYRVDMQPAPEDLRVNSTCGVDGSWHYEPSVIEAIYSSIQIQASGSCALSQSIEADRIVVRGAVALFLMKVDDDNTTGVVRQYRWPIEISFTREVTANVRVDVARPVLRDTLGYNIPNLPARVQLYKAGFVQPVSAPIFFEGDTIYVQLDVNLEQAWEVGINQAWLSSRSSGTPTLIANISNTLQREQAPNTFGTLTARFTFVGVPCEDCELHILALLQLTRLRRLHEVPGAPARHLREVPGYSMGSGVHTGHASVPGIRIRPRVSDLSPRLQGSLDLEVTDPKSFAEDPRVRTAAVTAVQTVTAEPRVVVVMAGLPRRLPGEANVRAIYNINEPLADFATSKILASIALEDLATQLNIGLREAGVTGAASVRVLQHQPPQASLARPPPVAVGEQPGDEVLPAALGVVALLLSTCGFGFLWTLTRRYRRLRAAR